MGGPLGLAFAGASIAAGVWAKHQQDSAQKVAEHKQAVAQLTGTLDQSTGAFTAATRAQAAKDLSDKGLLESSKRYGLALSDVTDAYLGQPGAIEKVNAALDSQNERYKSANSYYNEHGRLVEVNDKKNRSFKDSLNEVAGSGKDAQRALQLQNEAMKQTSSAATPAKTAVQQLADAQKKSAGAVDAMKKSLHDLNNTYLQMEGGVDGWEASIDSATSALKENGRTLDEHTEKGRANRSALRDMASSAQTALTSMADNGSSAGQVSAKYREMREQIIQSAMAFGRSRGEAEQYVSSVLKLPKQVKTKVDLEADAAEKAFASLKDDAVKLDGSKVVVEAKALNDKNVKAALEAIPGVQHDKQGNLIVDTKALNAEQTRAALKGVENAAVTADGKIIMIPSSAPNAAQTKAFIESISGAAVRADSKSVTITNSAPLSSKTVADLQKIEGVAVSADRKSVIVSNSSKGTALTDLQAVLNKATTVDGKHATVTITTVKETINRTYNEAARSANSMFGANLFGSARGNVFEGGAVRTFARGGVENHEPQIARPTPGRVRVWAEPETQGEAYIPFANDGRRGRAKSITEYVARRFGGSVTWHADGSADDWTPDMSGIMAYAASLKVDPSALTDQRKKVADQSAALNKAIRDLKAAQAGVRGKSGAARVKAENAVATAMERQAKAQRDLNDGRAKLNQMSAGASADTTTRFMMGTTSQNGITQRFLDNIERIRKRGFPRLARSLLEQGDSDAQAIAQTLSGGALSRLESAQAGLDTSDKLADRKAQMLDDLKGVTSGGLAESAQAQANAQLIAMQAANQRIAWASGPTTARLEARLDVLADAIRSQPAPIVQASPVKVITQLDSRPIAESTFGHGAREAQWGSVLPGAEGGW